jgi:hypothetical protein
MMFLLTLMALVIDIGSLQRARQGLRNVADAAALAGARKLPSATDGKAVAAAYYARNRNVPEGSITELGAEGNTTNYRIGDDEVAITTPYQSSPYLIRVVGRRPVEAHFARVFGIGQQTVPGAATAIHVPVAAYDGPETPIPPVTGMEGIVPWVLYAADVDTFVVGQQYTLKQGPHGSETGNFQIVQLVGSGATIYKQTLLDRYRARVAASDTVQTEPGNKSGKTREAVETILARGDRIVICLVSNSPIPNGTGPVVVAGFAAFRLDSVEGTGNQSIVHGTYLPHDAIPGKEPNFDGPNVNVRVVGLIE